MRVVLIRHGKVDYVWRKRSTSAQFDEDCEQYDRAPILPVRSDIPPVSYAFNKIYISTLRRSRDTAEQLFPGRQYTVTGLIDEVPLCAGMTGKKKMPVHFWNITGRLQWVRGGGRQKENRQETCRRAEEFVKMISEKDEDCVVITHGFYMHTLIHVLRQNGFRVRRMRIAYANGGYVTAEKS